MSIPCPASALHVFSAGILVLLAGCSSLGVDYTSPQSGLTPSFAARGTSGPAISSDTQWWLALNDKVLNGLIEQGLAQNLTVAQALEAIEAARATARINGVAYDPSVNLRVSSAASGTTAATSMATTRYAGIDASWEVDFFGTAKRNKAMQQANVDAAVQGANEARLTLIGDISRTYVDIRSYQRRLTLARAALKTQQETTGIVGKQFEAGTSNALAVARSQGQSQTTKASIPAIEVALQQSINALAVLLGQEPGAIQDKLASSGAIPRVRAAIGVGIPADLLRNRPDIRQAERALAAAVENIGISEAALYPSLSLSGSLSTTGTIGNWSLGPTLNIPIFNRDKLIGSVDLASSKARSAYLAYRTAVLAAEQDVEDAIVAYTKERTRRSALAEAVASYIKAEELSRSLYAAGSTDYGELLDAQTSLQSAQDSLAQSDAKLATAYIALAKALGGGWAAVD